MTESFSHLFEPPPELLIVDDIAENLEVLAGILSLSEHRFEISFAMSGEEALATIANRRPDLILLDVNMPGMNGFEVCRTLKDQAVTRDIPVIFLTARSADDDLIKGFDAGAVDYLTKPFNHKELVVRVRTHLQLKRMRELILRQNNELLELNQHLREQAIRDTLTGLYNRRQLDEILPMELHRAGRKNRVFALMLLDVDYFKRVNDTYGHAAGDALLRALGAFLTENVRAGDFTCRYGGEEFLLLLTEANREVAFRRAEELRQGIKQLQISHEESTLPPVTLSVGIALFPEHGTNAEILLKAADMALYQAKSAGRDRTVIAVADAESCPAFTPISRTSR